MPSARSTIDFALEQMADSGPVTARPMFGEYALYHGEKLVALITDNQLYIKPTEPGRTHSGTPTEAPPYRGAKPCFLIPADQWEDAAWLSTLIRLTASALPPPKPKRKPPPSLPKP